MSYYTLTMGIFRLAVPFFFVVSGYFYYKKIREERSIKNNILKIIKVFFIVELIEILIYTPILVGQKDFSILLYLWKIFSTGLGTTGDIFCNFIDYFNTILEKEKNRFYVHYRVNFIFNCNDK